jgi:hypothetical protein
VSAGSVEIKDGRDGKLVLRGDLVYFAMKIRSNPEERSGHQNSVQTPPHWRVTPQAQAQADRKRQQAAGTLEIRREEKKVERWQRITDKLIFWR